MSGSTCLWLLEIVFFIRTTFRLVIIGTSSQILKLKDQKSGFWNILPIIRKIKKRILKNKKFENPSTTHKFYDIERQLAQVRYYDYHARYT